MESSGYSRCSESSGSPMLIGSLTTGSCGIRVVQSCHFQPTVSRVAKFVMTPDMKKAPYSLVNCLSVILLSFS